jgi:hypothetical protein
MKKALSILNLPLDSTNEQVEKALLKSFLKKTKIPKYLLGKTTVGSGILNFMRKLKLPFVAMI